MGDPVEVVNRYVGAGDIQHDPLVHDGKQGFIEHFEKMASEYQHKEIEFLRAIAEGDFVVLNTHQIWPGDQEYVTIDVFRFDDNHKIIEHRGALQQVPGETKSGNAMY